MQDCKNAWIRHVERIPVMVSLLFEFSITIEKAYKQCELQLNSGSSTVVYSACEPRNYKKNVASLGRIEVSPKNATCGSPKVQFCSLVSVLVLISYLKKTSIN